jgi:hypothetical protein
MFVCFVLWTACSALYDLHGNLAAGKTVIFFIFLHGVFYNIAWSGLLVGYTVEIMPYKIRAKVGEVGRLDCAVADVHCRA